MEVKHVRSELLRAADTAFAPVAAAFRAHLAPAASASAEELQALAGTVFLHGPRPTRFGPT